MNLENLIRKIHKTVIGKETLVSAIAEDEEIQIAASDSLAFKSSVKY